MKRVIQLQRCIASLPSPLLGGIALAGCGGGAETTQNPVTTGGPTRARTYSGPAPATADIQAFRVEFWENVRGDESLRQLPQRRRPVAASSPAPTT